MKVKLSLGHAKFDNRKPFTFSFGGKCKVTYWSVSKKQAINRFLSEIGSGVPFKLEAAKADENNNHA